MVAIRPLAGEEEARRCAEMMCSTEPWITIGRNFNASLKIIRDATREVYVADNDGRLEGFIILNMRGAFVGYIQTVCVDASARGAGLGTQLVQFAEKRIFAETPNVFLCVSSFNPRARQLYERLGYALIGELKDYLIRGHSELLMRKTIGPLL
jgi:[ribosomal protein S18]-alanine N-acetyltransferase